MLNHIKKGTCLHMTSWLIFSMLSEYMFQSKSWLRDDKSENNLNQRGQRSHATHKPMLMYFDYLLQRCMILM